MREAVRRLLWLTPTLVVITLLAFWATSRALTLGGPQAGLPLFFNPAPVGVREVAWQAATAVAAGGVESSAGEQTLVRLGGAALPHVLPRLGSLSAEGRQRVARALTPVAARMDTAIEQSLRAGDSAADFWSRFWDDNFVDFNAAIARRVVRRYAERPAPLRERDLRRLDAFALDEIVRQMSEFSRAEQWDRVQRLTTAAAHITGQPWELAPNATEAEAQTASAHWQSFWAGRRREYVTLQGVERMLSPLLQTRYATWVGEAVRTEFGFLPNGEPALGALVRRAPISLALLLVGLLGGTALGISSGALTALLSARTARVVESIVAAVLVSAPLGLLLLHGKPESPVNRLALAALSMLLLGALLVTRYQRASSQRILEQGWVRCQRALGVSRPLLLLLTLRPSSNLVISTMAPHTSTLLTGVFVLEFALDLEGLGPTTLRALQDRELGWVMLITIATASLVGLVQVLSDLLLSGIDPMRSSAGERGGLGD